MICGLGKVTPLSGPVLSLFMFTWESNGRIEAQEEAGRQPSAYRVTDTRVAAALLYLPSIPVATARWEELYPDLTKIRELGGLLSTATKNERLLKELGMLSPDNTGFI